MFFSFRIGLFQFYKTIICKPLSSNRNIDNCIQCDLFEQIRLHEKFGTKINYCDKNTIRLINQACLEAIKINPLETRQINGCPVLAFWLIEKREYVKFKDNHASHGSRRSCAPRSRLLNLHNYQLTLIGI